MAACVTVQLGQCGTQVGHELLNVLYDDAVKSNPLVPPSVNKEYESSSLATFFNETQSGVREARSIMIDMEQKAVTCAVQDARKRGWKYAEGQQFCQRSGSGNNWSYGFKIHAPRCEDAVADLVRKEVEKCDHFGGFLVISSLAGGTGSGLGSYITRMLRDTYPQTTIINPVVCPYADGEVAVQNYNAVLSLAHTCTTTDANILLYNDNLHRICNKLLGIKNVSFRDVNGVIANQLASLLQPVSSMTDSVTCSQHFNVLNEIVMTSACHGNYTMLDLKSLPHVGQGSLAYSTFSWDALWKRIYQMLITDFYMDEGLDWHRKLSRRPSSSSPHPKYSSNLLTMRGHHALSPPDQSVPDFNDERLYPRWIPSCARCSIWKTNVPFMKYEKSISLLSNGTSCIKPLNNVVSKAWQMYGSGAYLHQYAKYGLENDDFITAFAAVESVISAYKQL